MASVVLEAVSKTYPGGARGVETLDLAIVDREFVVLVGPSGCGKTTTLRLIAGLEGVSAGRVLIGGRVVTDVAPKDRNIAMVFQSYALYPHLNVFRNMAFGLELRYGGNRLARWLRRWRRPAEFQRLETLRREIPGRVREAAKALGIEDYLDRMPGQLSGGERQRVALGRAMVRQPDAFLFDEPLSNLDAQLRDEMRRELKRLHRRLRATMIYVTHDQVEALSLGDRIVVMDRGRIQQVGGPWDVYHRPRNKFVAGFIGTPPMNFVPGHLSGDGFEGGGLKLDWKQPGIEGDHDVEAGIRPEDIQVSDDAEQAIARARVAEIEPLGDAMLLQLELLADEPSARLTCRTAAHSRWVVGDQVAVAVDPARVHWFDSRSGLNLVGAGEIDAQT